MALNIKNEQVENLVSEIAALTGETKTEAVRKALEERKQRLILHQSRPARDPFEVMNSEIWSAMPADVLGRGLAYEPVDEILGFGADGIPQ